jgi:hypothetical protein
MLPKHNLRPAAREMNIVPGLHSTLISVPKLADAGYTTVFSKAGAAIYDDYTTTISASNPPVLDRSALAGIYVYLQKRRTRFESRLHCLDNT